MLTRQGTCNLCGQCCGADGSPNQDNPWPDNWPGALERWDTDYLLSVYPMFSVFVHPAKGGELSGRARIGNQWHRFIWVPGEGLCKDLPPYGSTASYSLECPLLLPDPGDGTRPCALVGTEHGYIQQKMCEPRGPLEMTEEQATQWAADHPLCSHTWE
jgi:hypothetical protein